MFGCNHNSTKFLITLTKRIKHFSVQLVINDIFVCVCVESAFSMIIF